MRLCRAITRTAHPCSRAHDSTYNWLAQFYKLRLAYRMALDDSASRGLAIDWFVRVRTDMLHLQPLPQEDVAPFRARVHDRSQLWPPLRKARVRRHEWLRHRPTGCVATHLTAHMAGCLRLRAVWRDVTWQRHAWGSANKSHLTALFRALLIDSVSTTLSQSQRKLVEYAASRAGSSRLAQQC